MKDYLPPCPYPGLRPFEVQEAHLFFGRERAVAELLQKLQSSRFIAVLGSSGSGKSSLVRAGLIPRLQGGFITERGGHWRFAVMRPGDSPLRNLAASLLDAFDEESTPECVAGLVEEMRQSGARAVTDRLAAWTKETPASVLLLVDQFEEVFRLATFKGEAGPGEAQDERVRRGHEAADFVSIMLELAGRPSLSVYVVMTLRSDFFGDCVVFYGLPEAMNRSQYLIPRLSRQERHEAIEGPARVAGGLVSAELLDRVLNDMNDEPDQLPLMQHAMRRTWERAFAARGGGEGLVLNLADYEAVGGVRHSLSHQAEEVFSQFDERARHTCEKLFRLLCETGPNGYLARRMVRVAEVEAVAEASADEVRAVAGAFSSDSGGGLLMPPPSVPLTHDTVLDISHEALLRNWERLGSWAEMEAKSRDIYLRVEYEARMHAEGNSALLSDPTLELVLAWVSGARPTPAWAARYGGDFASVMEFISRSERARGEELRSAGAGALQGRGRRKKKIFISYRREDNPDAAARIHGRLIRHFGKGAVFYDIDSIPYGEAFMKVIETSIRECGMLLVIIGKDWNPARLKDPEDPVRVEIETAQKADVKVIPVVVGPERRDPMPRAEDLPPSLRWLTTLNYAPVFWGKDFNNNVAELIEQIEQRVGLVNALARLLNRLSAQS